MKKKLSQEVEFCEYCYFFTRMWQVEKKWTWHRVFPYRKRKTEDVYVCDHACRFGLELKNIIISGQGEDVKNVPIPDWCPLPDQKDPGVKVGVTGIIVRDEKFFLVLEEMTVKQQKMNGHILEAE